MKGNSANRTMCRKNARLRIRSSTTSSSNFCNNIMQTRKKDDLVSLFLSCLQDIIGKITAACRGGPNSETCILSSHGSVSTVALHKPGNILTYEVLLFTYF
ncbi:hypothetical protein P8452_39264 [Trifolium repens]|nr:hypothetical protein P8452_39264 [Trifolium repens]